MQKCTLPGLGIVLTSDMQDGCANQYTNAKQQE